MPRAKEIEFEIELPNWWWATEKCLTPEARYLKWASDRMRARLKRERQMLNEAEEQKLREMVRNSSPMQPVNPGQNYNGQPTEGQHIAHLVRSWKAPVLVAGPPLGPTDNRPPIKALGEDAELLERTKHVRKPKETMMEFFARVGLGAAQIRQMSRGEIERFVAVAAQQEPVQAPPTLTEPPRPVPAKFYIEV